MIGELCVVDENAFGAAAECYRLGACTLQIRAGGIVSICNRKSQIYNRKPTARVAELADAPDLGSGAEKRAGSSPVPGTYFFVKDPLPSSMYSTAR